MYYHNKLTQLAANIVTTLDFDKFRALSGSCFDWSAALAISASSSSLAVAAAAFAGTVVDPLSSGVRSLSRTTAILAVASVLISLLESSCGASMSKSSRQIWESPTLRYRLFFRSPHPERYWHQSAHARMKKSCQVIVLLFVSTSSYLVFPSSISLVPDLCSELLS